MTTSSTIAPYFGIAASVLLPLIPFPQLYHIYVSRSATGINVVYIMFQILANGVFLIYGSLIMDLYVIIPNALLILLNLIMMWMKWYFRRLERQQTSDILL